MKILISPISLEEAREVCEGGAHIVDIKNVDEGSLGANFPWIIRSIVDEVQGYGVICSATLGDLPYKPGTAALAALGAAHAGARYIKAGLHGTKTYLEAKEVMSAVVRACREYDPKIKVVAAGYADYRRFGGLDPQAIVQVGHYTKTDLVMLDTSFKDGKTLFDNMSTQEIADFVSSAHAASLEVALAGSVKQEHIPILVEVRADVVGIRGAVCVGSDRTSRIVSDRVRSFVNAVHVHSRVAT
jgi:(5-formylfuran-3-yl)methyl phosphate synthase